MHNLIDCFTERPLWNGLYRPLTTNLYYYLGGELFDHKIEIYHAINILFYILNAFLLYLVCREVLPGFWDMLPSAVMVTRLSHYEIVLNSCEFQVLFAVFLSLISLKMYFVYLRTGKMRPLIISVIVFALSLFAKETSVVMLAVLFLTALLFTGRPRLRSMIPYGVVAGLWAVLFVTVFRPISNNMPTGFSYDYSIGSIIENGGAYFLTIFNPLVDLIRDLIMPEIILEIAGSPIYIFLFVIVLVNLLWFSFNAVRKPQAYRIRVKAVLWGTWFFLVAISPYLFFDVRVYMRYAYFAHFGQAVAIVALLIILFNKMKGIYRGRIRAI
jgi:Flp pilus assembly pilin Flp